MKESPVFVKTLDFLTWLIPLTISFPRAHRFAMTAELQRDLFALHEALVRAGHSDTPGAALEHLHEAGVRLTLIRFKLRMCAGWSLVTTRQYEHAVERLAEIGRLVRGWQGSCSGKAAASARQQA